MGFEIRSASTRETKRLGRTIGKLCRGGEWIGLTGELGAGKTCLTGGIALGLGVPKDEAVVSPTFVIQQNYFKSRLPLFHFDLYRLGHAEELFELGYQETISQGGVTVVEWFEQVDDTVPKDHLILSIFLESLEERLIRFSGNGRLFEALQPKIKK